MSRAKLLPAALLPVLAIAASAAAARATELPDRHSLEQRMGRAAEAVVVHEPHLSVGDRHVRVRYTGYRTTAVLARLFGPDWRQRGDTVEFRALDGYVSRIAVRRLLGVRSWLVFARADGAAFTVDNLQQNETDVPLGPYYLVWDTVGNPALLAEGARNWPYQVAEIGIVARSDRALRPPGLAPRFFEGAGLTRTHCLTCHTVNGFGGAKFPGDLAALARGYAAADFIRLVLDPSSVRQGATMPPLADRQPEAERRRMARAVFDYLRAMPVPP